MSLAIGVITFDCDQPRAVADFWSRALDRPIGPEPSDFFVQIPPTDASPGMFFIKVPEGKTVKNRVHLDLHSPDGDRATEIDRLLGLGAERMGDHDEWGHTWTTLRDIEGNEFCVVG
jgi:hypothetical protein